MIYSAVCNSVVIPVYLAGYGLDGWHRRLKDQLAVILGKDSDMAVCLRRT